MLLELGGEHSGVLRWNVNVENVAFIDLSSHHRLVNRDCHLFPGPSLFDILSLVLDPDDLSDAPSTAVDEWILRLDHPVEHLYPDDSRIVAPKDETFQELDLSRSY